MNRKPWVRPVLAFAISFGLLAMVGVVVRSAVLVQHIMALGTRAGDLDATAVATREMMRLDKQYGPLYLAGVLILSTVCATIFALWRPKPREALPPPLPHG